MAKATPTESTGKLRVEADSRGERTSMVTATAAVAPPDVHAPTPPSAPAATGRKAAGRLLKATDEQVAEAPLVGQQLTASHTYSADFGEHAPNATTLAMALSTLAAWHAEADAADAWAAHAHTRKAQAAHAAMTLIEAFREEWDYAVKHDPNIAKRYPAMATFLSARQRASARGAATRRAKKRAKKA